MYLIKLVFNIVHVNKYMFHVSGTPFVHVRVRAQAISFKCTVWTRFNIIYIMSIMYLLVVIIAQSVFYGDDVTFQFYLMLI